MGLLMEDIFETNLDAHMESLYHKCSNIAQEIAAIKLNIPELGDLTDDVHQQLIKIIYKLASLQETLIKTAQETLNDLEVLDLLSSSKLTLTSIENNLALNKHCYNIADIIATEQAQLNQHQNLMGYIREVIGSFELANGKYYVIMGYFSYIAAILIKQHKLTEEEGELFLGGVRNILAEKKAYTLSLSIAH